MTTGKGADPTGDRGRVPGFFVHINRGIRQRGDSRRLLLRSGYVAYRSKFARYRIVFQNFRGKGGSGEERQTRPIAARQREEPVIAN